MKKQTLALAAILLVSLMLTACSGWGDQTKEAYSVYLEAFEKHQTTKASDISIETREIFTIGLMTSRTVTKMHIIGDVTDEANPALFLKVREDSDGEISETTVYYYNGHAYAEVADMKVKQTLSAAEIIEEYRTNAVPALFFDEAKVINGIIRNVDGGKEITFTVTNPASEEYIKIVTSSFADMFENGGADPAKISVTADDMDVTAFVDKDGVLKSFSFILILKIKYANETGNVNMLFKSNVNAIDNVAVPKPEDESAYITM